MTKAWWDRVEGIAPWAEHNQGLISIIALAVALLLALLEFRRANLAEARARRAAAEAKAETEGEAQAAEVARRLSEIAEFATAVRGVIVDVEVTLHEDRAWAVSPILPDVPMEAPNVTSRQAARAAVDTLNALLGVAPVSPTLIRATCAAVRALLPIDDERVSAPSHYASEQYGTWIDGLTAVRAAITDAELESQQRLIGTRSAPRTDGPRY